MRLLLLRAAHRPGRSAEDHERPRIRQGVRPRHERLGEPGYREERRRRRVRGEVNPLAHGLPAAGLRILECASKPVRASAPDLELVRSAPTCSAHWLTGALNL